MRGPNRYCYLQNLLWNLLDLVIHLEKGGCQMSMTVVVAVMTLVAVVVGQLGWIVTKAMRIYLKISLVTVERHRSDCCRCRRRSRRRDFQEESSLFFRDIMQVVLDYYCVWRGVESVVVSIIYCLICESSRRRVLELKILKAFQSTENK